MKGKLEDKEWLVREYVEEYRSVRNISTELRVSDSTVKKWLDIHGVRTRGLRESRMPKNKNFDKINNEEYIRKLYEDEGLTCEQIAKKLSCGTQTIYRRLREYGIEVDTFVKKALDANPDLGKLRSKSWLYQKYITEDRNTPEIGEMLGTSPTVVAGWLHRHEIPIKSWHETHGEKYTDEQLEQAMRALHDKLERIPSARDLNKFCKEGLCPSAATYALRGGIPFWQKKLFGKSLRRWRAWEYECIHLFNKVLDYPEFKREKRFNWLRSPLSNYHLRVDVYYPELKLCVEFDGVAHFKPIKFLQNQDKEEQFRRTQIHDETKNNVIPSKGLKLIRFKYDEPVTEEHVARRLSQAGIKVGEK